MDYQDKMRAAADKRHVREKVGQEVLELKKTVETSLRTVFIGGLARCEKYFGRVWGHGQESKNENQAKWGEVWQKMREDILDFSNKELRKLLKKLENYRLERQNPQVKEGV